MRGSVQLRPVRSNFCGGFAVAAVVAIAVAGCIVQHQAARQPRPSTPTFIRRTTAKQIAIFLSQQLLDRADFRGARIAQPVLKPVGDSQHYVVCLQFNGHSEIKSKVAIYLAGQITQFIDSTPEQCGDAAYQPFTELEQTLPEK